LRDQLVREFTAIRIDMKSSMPGSRFVNRVQPKLVKRVSFIPAVSRYSRVRRKAEIDKAVRRVVWLKSGGYIVINQTEALVAIDVNTGKFVGKSDKLGRHVTRTISKRPRNSSAGEASRPRRDYRSRPHRHGGAQESPEGDDGVATGTAHDRSPSKILSIKRFWFGRDNTQAGSSSLSNARFARRVRTARVQEW